MQLMKTGDHLLLPFVSRTIDLERDSDRTSAQRGGVKYYSRRSNKKEVNYYTPGHSPKEAEGSDRNGKSTYRATKKYYSPLPIEVLNAKKKLYSLSSNHSKSRSDCAIKKYYSPTVGRAQSVRSTKVDGDERAAEASSTSNATTEIAEMARSSAMSSNSNAADEDVDNECWSAPELALASVWDENANNKVGGDNQLDSSTGDDTCTGTVPDDDQNVEKYTDAQCNEKEADEKEADWKHCNEKEADQRKDAYMSTRTFRKDTSKPLSRNDITKLHLHLKHGTATAIENYIRAAGMWDKSLKRFIDDVLLSCPCRLAFAPSPHPKVASRPPSSSPQSRISIDVIKLGGKNFLHSVDECTLWSEAAVIYRKSMDIQISALRRIQQLRHCPPGTIRCDREYDNSKFRAFCSETNTALIPVAANDHEANGLIENANRTLRSFFDRIRACDRRSPCEVIVSDAMYGKKICAGSKGTSAFELLYGRRPQIMPSLDSLLPTPMSIATHAQHSARRRLQKMLRTRVYAMTRSM